MRDVLCTNLRSSHHVGDRTRPDGMGRRAPPRRISTPDKPGGRAGRPPHAIIRPRASRVTQRFRLPSRGPRSVERFTNPSRRAPSGECSTT